MKKLTIFLTILLVLNACSFPPSASDLGTLAEVAKPQLAVFTGPNPLTPGNFSQDRDLGRGDELYLSNNNAVVWLRFLGVEEGRPKWQCVSNHPSDGSKPCQGYEEGVKVFYWGDEIIATNEDELGLLFVDQGWMITNELP